jgi:hypothetical protein
MNWRKDQLGWLFSTADGLVSLGIYFSNSHLMVDRIMSSRQIAIAALTYRKPNA